MLENNNLLTKTWFIGKDCQMIKKWDNHFPDGNSHLKAEKKHLTVPNHCLICTFMSSKLIPVYYLLEINKCFVWF